jgi:hypothetical protein
VAGVEVPAFRPIESDDRDGLMQILGAADLSDNRLRILHFLISD